MVDHDGRSRWSITTVRRGGWIVELDVRFQRQFAAMGALA
jgi:hypothetical protein